MEKWTPANEGFYTAMSGDKVKKQGNGATRRFFQTGDSPMLVPAAASRCEPNLLRVQTQQRNG